MKCSPMLGLTATNLTMSTCHVPQDSRSEVAPIIAGTLGMMVLIIFGWDDGMILAALLCAFPLNCLMFPLQKYGMGNNMWTIPFDHITKMFKYLYVAEVFYMPTGALTQLSFLAFYLRIFPNRGINLAAYGLMGLSVVFGISNTLVMIFQCTPVPFFWNQWTGIPTGTCVNVNTFSWYKAALQIAMDLAIIALPIRPLSRLTLKTKKKVQVILMFCTGFVITIVSCLRLQSLVKFSNSSNPSYDNAAAVYWSVAESDIAIICACMPFVPSLLKHLLPSVFGEPTNNPKYYNNITPSNRYYNSVSANQAEPQPGQVPLDRIKMETTWHVSSSETNLVDGSQGSTTKPFHSGAA
ncbi:hypothetical protein PHISP_01897 [Aspergillus sp. HF37]|nr:hypothetical protein PHISP_01897 [Aspergillus sp. HF37]